MTRDFGAEAQEAAEAHLELLELATFQADTIAPFLQDVEVDSAGPYCGCTTCVVRETLHAAYPVLREGIFAEARAFYLGEQA